MSSLFSGEDFRYLASPPISGSGCFAQQPLRSGRHHRHRLCHDHQHRSATATGCSIAPFTSLPASFVYQTTDPATNQVTGSPNTPVNIAAGAAQSFVFAITPTAPIAPTDVQFSFDCTNTDPAPINVGLNTLLLSASATPVPDIVALAATLTNDGIVNIPGANGTGAFAVATVNVGASGSITASADTGERNTTGEYLYLSDQPGHWSVYLNDRPAV